VNGPAIRHVPDLFPRNERVACYLESAAGRIAVVAVGAFNVGRIELVFDEGWSTNRPGARAADRNYEDPVRIGRKDELLVFHLGSTIVLLFEADRMRFDETLRAGGSVRVGQAIGSIIG
jgi:phosphatidylserine decarboxylase